MFSNNINGNKNKIKINQKNGDSKNTFTEIIIGLIITVVGGIILYLIVGS